MLNSDKRYQSICGLLIGTAIGDALCQPQGARTRKVAVRKFALRRLRYRMWPGQGLYTDDTQLALMAGQAVLQSRSHSSSFHKHFQRRLKWYALGLPVGCTMSTFLASLKTWLSIFGVKSGCWSAGSAPASRALLLGVVLHNTGHRYLVWSRDSAETTHRHQLAIDGAGVLATAAQVAAVTASARLNPESALEAIVKASKEDELRDALVQLQPFLQRGSSPRAVVRHFQWESGISRAMLPTTVMAVYCFLRYPQNFRRAVKWALLISGKNCTLPAVVAGLVGAHIGVSALPAELVEDLGDWPHGQVWIERLSLRLADWPHGVDDLLVAPPLAAYPLAQLLRNLFRWPLVMMHKFIGMLCS